MKKIWKIFILWFFGQDVREHQSKDDTHTLHQEIKDDIEIRAIDAESQGVSEEAFVESENLKLDRNELACNAKHDKKDAYHMQTLEKNQAEHENLTTNFSLHLEEAKENIPEEVQIGLDDLSAKEEETISQIGDTEVEIKKQTIKCNASKYDQNQKPLIGKKLTYFIPVIIAVIGFYLNQDVFELAMGNVPIAGIVLTSLMAVLDGLIAHKIGKAFGYVNKGLGVFLSLIGLGLLGVIFYTQYKISSQSEFDAETDLTIPFKNEDLDQLSQSIPFFDENSVPIDVLPLEELGYLGTQIERHPIISSMVISFLFLLAVAFSWAYFRHEKQLLKFVVLQRYKKRLSYLKRFLKGNSDKVKRTYKSLHQNAKDSLEDKIKQLASSINNTSEAIEISRLNRENELNDLKKLRAEILVIIRRVYADS